MKVILFKELKLQGLHDLPDDFILTKNLHLNDNKKNAKLVT